jgi:hypothetical protein
MLCSRMRFLHALVDQWHSLQQPTYLRINECNLYMYSVGKILIESPYNMGYTWIPPLLRASSNPKSVPKFRVLIHQSINQSINHIALFTEHLPWLCSNTECRGIMRRKFIFLQILTPTVTQKRLGKHKTCTIFWNTQIHPRSRNSSYQTFGSKTLTQTVFVFNDSDGTHCVFVEKTIRG